MTDRDDPGFNDPRAGDAFVEEEPEVEAIFVDIAATRSEMADTVDALGERLAPSAVAGRAGDAVRDATIGRIESKVNDMSTTASDLVSNAGETVQQTGEGILDTIRRNPVPAALAGIGIGWLVVSRSQSGSSSRAPSPNRRPLRTGWVATGDGWRRSDRGPFDVGDALDRRARSASAAFENATADARQSIGDSVDELGDRASRAAETFGSTAADTLAGAQRAVESNPLAFGALAVAVGTAIGLALPATTAEKRMMGPTGGRLIDQVEHAVSQPLDEMAGKRRSGSSASSRSGTATSGRSTTARTSSGSGSSRTGTSRSGSDPSSQSGRSVEGSRGSATSGTTSGTS